VRVRLFFLFFKLEGELAAIASLGYHNHEAC